MAQILKENCVGLWLFWYEDEPFMNQQVDGCLGFFFLCVMVRILYGRKHHRTQPGACLYDSSHSPFLTQQPLKSNPTVTRVGSQISSSDRLDATRTISHTRALYLLTLSVRRPQFQFIQFVLHQDHPSALDIIWTTLCRRLACIPLCLRLTGWALTFKSPWERTTAAEQEEQIDAFTPKCNGIDFRKKSF